MHWTKRRDYNKGWHYEVLISKNKAKIHGRPEHARVIITIDHNYYGRKPMDLDNLVASNKPLIDGLTTNGIIKDDNPDCVTRIFCNQTLVSKYKWGTAIKIDVLQDTAE